MSRKGFVVVLVITLLSVLLVACEGGKPKNMSDSHYNLGLKALEIADNYLDFDIEASEAHDKIQELYSKIDELPKTTTKDPGHAVNSGIEADILVLSTSLLSAEFNGEKYDYVLETRNNLAKDLNQKTR